jgi:hypothetical protein
MPTSNSSPNPGVAPGKVLLDEAASTLPAEPANIMQGKNQPGQEPESAAAPPQETPGNEEPELLLEPDLPSDGRDEEGEAMIRDLPQRPELSEPPSQPRLSNIKP